MVAEEVDKELPSSSRDHVYGGREFTGLSADIRDFLKNKDDSSAKDDTWARLTEMAGFSLGGFGFFKTRLGMGTYNRERKADILRKFTTDKDALWGGGLRGPIGNRISHDAAALTWGTANTYKLGDDVLTLADCTPFAYEAYDSFTTDGKSTKLVESRHKPLMLSPAPPNNMSRCFPSFLDGGMPQNGLQRLHSPQQIHEAQPEAPPLHFLISAWESMTYRYISDVVDGTRRLLRMLTDNFRKTEYRRNALSRGVHGQPRRKCRRRGWQITTPGTGSRSPSRKWRR